ncbi:MAG TPA: J domain-containing protein [Acidimicrobiia bacterium]|nr:J domain-containing protein [Acidimicrobiia bacterium]
MDGRLARTILGVDDDAGPEELRRAFRARALVLHPDHGGDTPAFAELVNALDTLRSVRAVPMVRPALVAAHPRIDVYDSAPRRLPRRDFADVLRVAMAATT